MTHHTVTVTRPSTAAPHAVWPLLADASTWPHWSPVRTMTIERPAPDGSDGVGAIRRLKTALATSREEVLEMDPPHRFGYRLLSGLPLSDYTGTVTVTPNDDGGSTITWTSTFATPGGLRGWFWNRFITAAITSYCDGLARHAAKATLQR
jgi:uncharacterized protein YndB with AHSA1/START domain